jgi:ubiquinone/menaquinone biosynthesis C-methylase UbiE
MRVGLRLEGPIERVAGLAKQVPTPFLESFAALGMARAVIAGTTLGVFAALDDEPDDAAGLARRLELDERGVDVLLTALHAMGYLCAAGDGRFEVSADVRRWVLPGPRSLGDYIGAFNDDMWEAFGQLEAVVRGADPQEIHAKAPDDPYWERYMRALFQLSRLGGDQVARMIPARSPARLLDLAGGHAGFAMALCQRHEGLSATVVDLEGAARIGRGIVDAEGFADRIAYRVGDMFELDLGEGYDIATAHAILHHFPPERNVELLRRARAALRPGGSMAVLELERPPPGRAGSQVGTLTGLLFYVTSGARTYSAGEISEWFEAAGFTSVRARRHPRLTGSVLVVGRA